MWMIRWFRARVPRRRRVLDQVVADADHEIRPVEAGHDVVARLQADGHQRQVRAIVHRALAHERLGDRYMQALGEGSERVGGATPDDAVTGQDERPLGCGDERRRVRDRLLRRLGEVGAAGLDGDGTAVGDRRDLACGEVLGQLDVRGARLLERRRPEGLAHDLGERLDPVDARVPLRDRPHHLDDVDDLVGLLVELERGRLTGDRDHRRAIQVRIRDAGHEVRRAGSERRHGHGRPTGEASVHVGHERRALLVAGRDVADARLVSQGIEDVHRLLAGHGEDGLAALSDEAIDEQVGGAARSVG